MGLLDIFKNKSKADGIKMRPKRGADGQADGLIEKIADSTGVASERDDEKK